MYATIYSHSMAAGEEQAASLIIVWSMKAWLQNSLRSSCYPALGCPNAKPISSCEVVGSTALCSALRSFRLFWISTSSPALCETRTSKSEHLQSPDT